VDALFADAYQMGQWYHTTDLSHVAQLAEELIASTASERQTLWLHPKSPLKEADLNSILTREDYRRHMAIVLARYVPISPLPKGDKSRN
jgi:hypothetical protein